MENGAESRAVFTALIEFFIPACNTSAKTFTASTLSVIEYRMYTQSYRRRCVGTKGKDKESHKVQPFRQKLVPGI